MSKRRITELTILVLALSTSLIACGSSTASQVSTARTDSKAKSDDAIKKVMDEIDTAWNKGDATAFASNWAEDGIVISPMGELTNGRPAIEQDMIAQFAGPLKGTTHKLTVTRIHWHKTASLHLTYPAGAYAEVKG